MLETSQYLFSNSTTELYSSKIAWYWHHNRPEDQWSRRHRDTSILIIVIWFLIEVPKIYIREKIAFVINGAGKTIFICGRMKLDLYLVPCTKVNSEWIKDQESRPENL